MKIPAVWLAAAFATGILLRPASHSSPAPWLIASSVLVLGGAASAKFLRALWPAAVFAIAAWCALGAASVSIEQLAVPRDNVNLLTASGKIDTSEPLRWRGLLREDPLRLPWGVRYMIDIESVESAGRAMPAACAPTISGRKTSLSRCPRCAPVIASRLSSVPDHRAISWIPARPTCVRFSSATA